MYAIKSNSRNVDPIPEMDSVTHTIKTFWTGKRFVKLLLFALIMANVTMYCVNVLARRQVMENAAGLHAKIYTTYLQSVERMRQSTVALEKNTTTKTVSPYWLALREVRKQFPFFKLNIVLQANAVGEREHQIINTFKNRPRGWTLTDELDGWGRTYFVLPTKTTAALQVVSFVRDDLSAWQSTSLMIGIYAFILLFAFGWFWTRALADPNQSSDRDEQIRRQVQAISATMIEFDSVLRDLHVTLSKTPGQDVIRALDEIAAQIRLLAVNGSIEAARSAETYRAFNVMLQEINQLASKSREILKDLDLGEIHQKASQLDYLLRTKNATATDEPGFYVSPNASRRAR